MIVWLAAIWKAFLGTTIGRWLVGSGVVILAALGLAAVAFVKGKHAQADTDAAKDAGAAQRAAQEAADAVQHSADAVRATNDEISKMPDAGTQRIGDATAGP